MKEKKFIGFMLAAAMLANTACGALAYEYPDRQENVKTLPTGDLAMPESISLELSADAGLFSVAENDDTVTKNTVPIPGGAGGSGMLLYDEMPDHGYSYEYLAGVKNGEEMQRCYDGILSICRAYVGNYTDNTDENCAIFDWYAEVERLFNEGHSDYVYSLSDNETDMAFFAFMQDHPELWWLDNSSMKVPLDSLGEEYQGMIIPVPAVNSDFANGELRRTTDEAINTELEKYFDKVNELSEKDAYTVAKFVHDEICANVEYGYVVDADGKYILDKNDNKIPLDTAYAHSIIGVLDGNEDTDAVCEGYAKTYQLIMTALGHDCRYVIGIADGDGDGNASWNSTDAHGWNVIKLNDDKYYYVDVTWDDSTESYNWFAKGSETFDVDHYAVTPEIWSRDLSYFMAELPEIPEKDYDVNYGKPTSAPTSTPTAKPTATPTATPTAEPTATPTPYPTPAVEFFDYGSDYGYRDMGMRSNGEERQRIYDILLKYCMKLAGSYEDVEPLTDISDGGKQKYFIPGTYYLTSDGQQLSAYFEEAKTTLNNDELTEVYTIFGYDHPEFYWLSSTVTIYSMKDGINFVSPTIDEEYASGTYRKKLDETMDGNFDKLRNAAKSAGDEAYSKGKSRIDATALKLHDDIAMASAYGTDQQDTNAAHSIVSILDGDEETKAVCEGYAKTYQLVMNALGIDNVYVVGFGSWSNESHAWNYVQFENECWYGVDVTWDYNEHGSEALHDFFAQGSDRFSYADEYPNHIPYDSETSGAYFLYDLPILASESYEMNPSATPAPTAAPTEPPTPAPTAAPTEDPNATPSPTPDSNATPSPTPDPAATQSPTPAPTALPTEKPAVMRMVDTKVKVSDDSDETVPGVIVRVDKRVENSKLLFVIYNEDSTIREMRIADLEKGGVANEQGNVMYGFPIGYGGDPGKIKVFAWKNDSFTPVAKFKGIVWTPHEAPVIEDTGE